MLTSGSRPFARLKLSVDIPLIDGVQRIIPFDTVEISDSFGEIDPVNVGGFGSVNVFVCRYGIYLVQIQARVDVSPQQMVCTLNSESGSNSEDSQIVTYSPVFVNQSLVNSLNANRLSSEAIYPGTPTGFPTILYSTFKINGGGNGVLRASKTSMLIQQLTENL